VKVCFIDECSEYLFSDIQTVNGWVVVFCFRYTNVSVGMADVEEGLGVSKPVFPHEVTIKLGCVC